MNRLEAGDRPAHSWYRFVLSFPPHLVRQYLEDFRLAPGQRVLDPFCGTGTTVVEAKRHGIDGVGLEANAMAHFASTVKCDWELDGDALYQSAKALAASVGRKLKRQGVPDHRLEFDLRDGDGSLRLQALAPEAAKLLLANSISPRPLHKALVLLSAIDEMPLRMRGHARLALARTLVETASNLHFGPEVGVGPPKEDAPVLDPWLVAIRDMRDHLGALAKYASVEGVVHRADARQCEEFLHPQSIDAVITSPPYPNEKDYTRTTRLESVVLGFLRNKGDLQLLKRGLVRSNTRTVYRGDEDDVFVKDHAEIQRIAREIESRRIAMGKTSGFERMYHKVTTLYFGGMARHLAELRPALKPGARLAYVVGDQASFLRVMIRTGELLADIASSLGYEVVRIDLFRTRLATATREQLREETVVLRWPG